MLSLGCKARLMAAPSRAAPWAMTLSSSRGVTTRSLPSCAIIGWGDARRNHWQAQTGRVRMLAAAGLGRAEAGVGELQRPAQTLGFRRAEAVHADEGRGPHFPHQRTGQLLQAQTGGRRDARGHRRHRADALHRRTACAHRDKNFLDGAGAEGVGGDPAVAHAQHQHRPLRRQKRPQLVRCLLDDLGVPLVQHTDAGDFQRDVPPLGFSRPSWAISTRVTVTPPRFAVAARTPPGRSAAAV